MIPMKIFTALFFSSKYWPDAAARSAAANAVTAKLGMEPVSVITDGDLPAPAAYAGCDTLLVIPCSGSVQPDILALSRHFSRILLFAAYVRGNFSDELCDAMLCRNAAPTVMDCYGVLSRGGNVTLIRDFAALRRHLRLHAACERVRGGKILMVGAPEPWVISVSREYALYRKQLGVEIEPVSHEELIRLYEATTEAEAQPITEYFAGAKECVEPTGEDIVRCARMASAMVRLIENHGADGMAIACFSLIGRLGVNPCLGVSWLNGETSYFAACEGDIDSAVTMLMMRALQADNPFMANPCLQADDTVNFAHCTAPLRVCGAKREFILRNHHETSVGASPRVLYGTGMRVSMLRYSGVNNAMFLHGGISVPGRYEPNCRTQLCVRADDYGKWTQNIQGCHQVLAFGDIAADAAALCALLGVEVV